MRAVYALVILLVVATGGLVFFLFAPRMSYFPDVAPGAYVGTLESRDGLALIPWFLSHSAGEQSVAVAVGDVRLPARMVAPSDSLGAGRQPLVIGDTEVRLRMVGVARGPGRYEGNYVNPISREQGRWTLSQLPPDPESLVMEQDLTRWVSLWQELELIEKEIQGAQLKADEQRVSIENLNHYVSDGDALRKTADVRLGRTDSELDAAKDELQQRQQQLDKMLRDFDLSQRVSQEGKLVFLSRETIRRESRWIELTLQLLAPETSLGFDQALERAERIQELKKKITKEREAAVNRSNQERYKGKAKETQNEEEFYEQMR